MSENADDLVRRLHEEEFDKLRQGFLPPQPAQSPGLHHSNLPEASPDSPLLVEWNVYRREVARLLNEGREGQAVLIKGDGIVGLFATEQEARAQGYRQFPCQAFLVHPIREYESQLRCVSVRICRS